MFRVIFSVWVPEEDKHSCREHQLVVLSNSFYTLWITFNNYLAVWITCILVCKIPMEFEFFVFPPLKFGGSGKLVVNTGVIWVKSPRMIQGILSCRDVTKQACFLKYHWQKYIQSRHLLLKLWAFWKAFGERIILGNEPPLSVFNKKVSNAFLVTLAKLQD